MELGRLTHTDDRRHPSILIAFNRVQTIFDLLLGPATSRSTKKCLCDA